MTAFGNLSWDDLSEPAPGDPQRPMQVAPALHCLCGRFAKYLGDQHYYNGQFDCYRYTIRCSRCGDVDIECV
jgi:hypothetical protein